MLGSCAWATLEQSCSSLWNRKLKYGRVTEMGQLKTSFFLNNISFFNQFQKSCQNNGIRLLCILSLQENKLSLQMYFTGPTLNYLHEVSNRCCFLHAGGMLLDTLWCCEDGCLPNITVQDRASLFPILVPVFVPFVLILFSTSSPKL